MSFTKNAATQATAHCIITTSAAHFPPSSRFTEAIAATHGVYKRLNTSIEAAARDVITVPILPANSTSSVDTTLSFDINQVISAEDNLQSQPPNGANTGAITLATVARILSCESLTISR